MKFILLLVPLSTLMWMASAKPQGPPGGCNKKTYMYRSPHRPANKYVQNKGCDRSSWKDRNAYESELSCRNDATVKLSASGSDGVYFLRIDQSEQMIKGLRVLPSTAGTFEGYPGYLSDSGAEAEGGCLAHNTRLTDVTPSIGDVIELMYKTDEGEPKFDVIIVTGNAEYSQEIVTVEN